VTEVRDFITGIATSRTNNLLAAGASPPEALTSGFQRAPLTCAVCPAVAEVIALRASNTRGEPVSADELQRDTKALYDTV